MKKIVIICVGILFLTIFQLNIVNAKEINTNNLNHVDVYIDGQVSIDTQINGFSQDYKQIVVDISDISIEIEDNNKKKIYANPIEKIQQGSKEKRYYQEVDAFSENATIIVNGKVKSEELNLNMVFNKIYSGEQLLVAIEECTTHNGCDIKITSEEVKNIITYDVIFKTEDGGVFPDNQEYIEHINIVSGEQFPDLPEVIANENYKFIGWYNEKTGLKIEQFPSTVTEDLVAIAKGECNEQIEKENSKTIETVALTVSDNNNIIALDGSNLKTLDSYIPPKTIIDNNIILLIVSFIICSTVTIGLGNKIRKDKKKEHKTDTI